VPIGADREIEVRELSARHIRELLKRYPDVLALLAGSFRNFENAVASAPEMMSTIISFATTKRDDTDTDESFTNKLKKAEAWADDLSLKTQIDIIKAVNEISFPGGGLGPFVGMIKAFALSASGNASPEPSVSLNGGDPDGKVSEETLPSLSSDSELQATPAPSGT
jgi:hypothetical protein